MHEAARSLFDCVKSESDIQAFVVNRKSEDLYLDFKQIADPSLAVLDDNARKFLAKGLSGFANSAGGVLVLGVDAPQNGQYQLKPISDVFVFEQRVLEQISRATTAPVPGVITKCISSSTIKGSGYVIVLVPASDTAPHRSHVDKYYYFRCGDSFLQMEHFQIADMFGRRHHPSLSVAGVLQSDVNRQGDLMLTLSLKNMGRALAKFPMLKLLETGGMTPYEFGVDGNRNFGLPCVPSRQKFRDFRGGLNDAVHIGASLEVVSLKIRLFVESEATSISPVVVKGQVAAEGFPVKEFTLIVNCQVIHEANLKFKQPFFSVPIEAVFD